MRIRSTTTAYSTIAKWIHWGTALLFLAAYCTVYYRRWFTEDKTPENWTSLQLHLSIGVTLAVLVILRIVWWLYDRKPNPEPGSKLEHLAAEAGHYALYAVMIIMPITGYLGTGAPTEFFFLFDIPKFEETVLFKDLIEQGLGIPFTEFEKPMDLIHKDIGGAWLVWILIVGHAAAALYHHFVKRDRTLIKMTTDRSA